MFHGIHINFVAVRGRMDSVPDSAAPVLHETQVFALRAVALACSS